MKILSSIFVVALLFLLSGCKVQRVVTEGNATGRYQFYTPGDAGFLIFDSQSGQAWVYNVTNRVWVALTALPVDNNRYKILDIQ